MQKELISIKEENEVLKENCVSYEAQLEDLKGKVKDDAKKIDKVCSDSQLTELKNVWKKEREEEKINFAKIVKKQIQDKTKDTLIQIIKEKENLVRDTVDRKKCMVIYGLQEKKNPNKYGREREERELVKRVIQHVQDDTQNLEQEIEETHRIEKFKEENARPLKVRMRSQVAVEEITARASRLAQTEEYKEIWVKRDMNMEERHKERKIRQETKKKT